MADKQLVLAIFKDEAAAESAVGMLRDGIDDYTEIDLGPIGILTLDEKGKIKKVFEKVKPEDHASEVLEAFAD